MAAPPYVGLAHLTASPDMNFKRFTSPEISNFVKEKELDPSLLQRLETTLYVATAVTNDAEQKQIKDPAVKKWLDALKDAVYDADDLLDELSTKAATQKQVSNSSSPSSSQDREMGNKIEKIVQRLDEIAKHRDILGLQNIVGDQSPQRPQSTSLVIESDVYGRQNEKEAVISLLLSGDTGDAKIGVVPIVGLGGIGKTTLAQLVYNDDRVKEKFDLRAWVCVSDVFDVPRIMRNIIEDISGAACNKTNLNSLQFDLTKMLKEKKFLVVLDDLWNERYDEWDSLITPFHHGSQGSKVIVTTRNVSIASTVQRDPLHHLSLSDLSDEYCWLIFEKHAAPSKHSVSDSFLKKVRGDIIKKCKGLPLAAKILGGLLRSKSDVNSWESILKNEVWECSDLENKVIPALRVSYHYLPPHLKRCFVYCSLFPKDIVFKKKELILLWMAEDLLQPTNRNMGLEEVGCECFDDLTSRLFFQPSNNLGDEYVMHDLIHDLAEFFAGKFYCRFENEGGKNFGNNVRHMSYYNLSGGPMELEITEFVKSAKALRTFLHLQPINSDVYAKDESQILELLLNCKCLRVLSLCEMQDLEVLPNSIGELIHLRYLDLSGTSIRFLPDSLCQLHNLQTLRLKLCRNLTRLPNDMQDLVNLRFLDVYGSSLEEMPRGMGKLKNLHYLSDFIVGKDQGRKIGELGGLSNLANWGLGGLSNLTDGLFIWNLQNVRNKEEVSQGRIMDKKDIKMLALHWDADDSQTQKDILEKLQPHQNLKIIIMDGYMGTKFSDWLGHHSYENMTQIYLSNCKNCRSLPPLGQLPYLKKLTLWGFEMLETIDSGFYKKGDSSSSTAFPSLDKLEFSHMDAWKEWCLFDNNAFPVLRRLTLYSCPHIVGDLPKLIPNLEELRIITCNQLSSPIPRALLIDTLEIFLSQEVILQTDQEGPISVKNLKIVKCLGLEFPKKLCGESMESLEIDVSCWSLLSLSVDTFPHLKRLRIRFCASLKSISVSQASLQNLTEVEICICPDLEEIQIEGSVPPNVTPWTVEHCPKLKPLPDHMIRPAP